MIERIMGPFVRDLGPKDGYHYIQIRFSCVGFFGGSRSVTLKVRIGDLPMLYLDDEVPVWDIAEIEKLKAEIEELKNEIDDLEHENEAWRDGVLSRSR